MARSSPRSSWPIAAAAAALLVVSASTAAANTAGVELWLDAAETERVRQNAALGGHVGTAWSRTLAEANAALNATPEKPSLGGWNPQKSFAEVYTKGNRDGQKALKLAYAWKVTGDLKYANKARYLLLAWAANYANPPSPMRHQVDETIPLMTFALAYDMTKNSPAFTSSQRSAMRTWFGKFPSRGKSWVTTNWQHINAYPGSNGHWANGIAWSLGMVALTGAQAGDLGAVHWATDRQNNMSSSSKHFSGRTYNLRRFITDGIRADGSSEDEHVRRELGYGLFYLAPITVTAAAVDDLGIDLWSASPNGRSLKLAYQHYAPFIAGVKPDPWPSSPLQPGKRRKYGAMSELAFRAYGGNALHVGVDWGSRGEHEAEPLIGYGALLADLPPDLIPDLSPVPLPHPPDAPRGAATPRGASPIEKPGPAAPADKLGRRQAPPAAAKRSGARRALGKLIVTRRGRRTVVRVRARTSGTVRITLKQGRTTVGRCRTRFVRGGRIAGCVRSIRPGTGTPIMAIAVLSRGSRHLSHVRNRVRDLPTPTNRSAPARSPR